MDRKRLLHHSDTRTMAPPPLAHDHDCAGHDCAEGYALCRHVDVARVTCLNERRAESCRSVFREWAKRGDAVEHPLWSEEDDPELLLTVPFTTNVAITAIALVSPPDAPWPDALPSSLRVFANRENVDFETARDAAPVQSWDLVADRRTQMMAEYPCRPGKFVGVHTLVLHIPSSFGGDETAISFVGFKGSASGVRREAPTHIVYEAQPTPEDAGKVEEKLGGLGGVM